MLKTLCKSKPNRFTARYKHEWVSPEGYDTGIKIHNRLVDKKVPLIFPNRHLVKWYICGPTVYDNSHIGHASCYVRFDIIRRILEKFFDIQPVIALGITDIDDKIIEKATRTKEDFKTIAKKYELEFLKELNELQVIPPAFLTRVSDHIPDVINFIAQIIDKGQGYQIKDGSIYFRNSIKCYNQLVTPPESPFAKLRDGQEHVSDFALWKAAKPGEPYWDSPWSKGRPGWHIECSAMASKLFGEKLDIHSGGADLMFPHHQNEEAQSCSYHGHDQWVNYWTHAGPMLVGFEKMSKSLRNSVLISDFLKEHTSNHFRMYCFKTHYRDALHYTQDGFKHCEGDCKKITNFLADAECYTKGSWLLGDVSESILLKELETTKTKLKEFLSDDFHTTKAYGSLSNLIHTTTRMLNTKPDSSSSRSPTAVATVSNFISDVYDSLGFQFKTKEIAKADDHLIEQILNESINFRSQIRKVAFTVNDKPVKQDLLQACDSVRDNLKTFGINVKDQGADKTSWAFVSKT